ncbi:MAG: CRISPR-associated endonuclease Cas6 [Dissulfuribacterales bacterium]
MKKSTLLLDNIRLNPSQIHKFRGFVGNLFLEHDLIHNHDKTGKPIYRYPLIQFKLIDKTPAIIAVTEPAIRIFSEIFMNMNEINIDGVVIPVFEKNLKVEDVEFGYSNETYVYEFTSPWIGLNQTNFKKYAGIKNREDRENILRKSLIGNILSMSKFLNHWLEPDQHIKVEMKLSEKPLNLKAKRMIGFTGIFKTNFAIPDFLGIGKSVSRGFGVVKKIL